MPETIAQINDRFREEITEGTSDLGGLFFCGDAVHIVPVNKLKIVKAIREWDWDAVWVKGGDPHGEREGGTVEVEGRPFNWKIFYYDRKSLASHICHFRVSEDPSDLEITVRHLNVTVAGK